METTRDDRMAPTRSGRRFVDALARAENAVGERSPALVPAPGMTLATHRAPAHTFRRGSCDEILVVAQRNIAATSVRFDLGWGWREHVCRAPSPVYVVPARADARWRLDGASQCVFLALEAAGTERLLSELGVDEPADFLWTLSARGFEENLVHEMTHRLWEAASGGPAASVLADGYRVAIVHALARRTVRPRDDGGNRPAARLSPPQLRRTLAFIDANLGSVLTVQAIAAEAGVSVFHFTRLFRGSTGTTPHAFVLRRRIERAAERLLAGDDPVADIGKAAGFPSASHFARTFAAHRGCSPQRWRQQGRRVAAGA